MIETKSDLLNAMAELKACPDATEWVHDQEGTAEEMWMRCNFGWMIWFAGRRNPTAIAAFARRCADRWPAAAAAYDAFYDAFYAAYDAADADAAAAANAAADAAAAAANAAAANAACANAANAARDAERQTQRDDLRAMWGEIR